MSVGMPGQLDAVDHQLLTMLQTQIPLVSRPYGAIARELGLTEAEVLGRVGRLKTGGVGVEGRGIIRQISAIFDSKSLGYRSTLVAAKVAERDVEEAARIINRHPGVSHNYLRNHAYNMWYTLAVPPDSVLGLEKTVEILHGESGAEATRMMPTLKLYKIGVRFDLSGEGEGVMGGGYNEERRRPVRELTAREKDCVRILQQDLPAESAPFEAWAKDGGCSTEEFLAVAGRFLAEGVMRRFSAVIRHREAGISANAMGVWVVPVERQDLFGEMASGFSAVSHCYLRQSYPDWPYTIFTMVHAPTKEQCEVGLAELSRKSGIGEYAALYSTREFKKIRVKYFLKDVAEWESLAGGR